MKNIKFRFWTGSLMEQWDHAKHWESLGFYLNGGDNYIPMMFTGLFDRHGKEIYEGDIVQWDTDIDADYFDSKLRFIDEKVKFEGGAFYPVCNMPEYEFEVIGNIYENPELIK